MASTTDSAAAVDPREDKPQQAGAQPKLPWRLRQLRWSTWRGVFVRSAKEFMDDNCADWAAALTYYGVLAVFPSAVVIVALVGLVSEGDKTVDTFLGLAKDMGIGSVVASEGITTVLKGVVEQQSSAKVLLSFGLLGAIWSASGYVGAFTRASNAIYEVEEGRPFYKLRPLQLGVTVVVLIFMAALATVLIISGPVADAIGNALHLGDSLKTAWSVAKWPVLVAILMLQMSLMFWIAPNVRQPRFRWLTVGGGVALVAWALTSLGFGFYVSKFSSYDVTYGSLGAIIAFLVWLYLSNCAVMFGVEINAELQRGRAIQAGDPDPKDPVLPPKSPADA
jgi:membrane protein